MADKLYMVQAGENLKSIATAQLGDESRWQELAHLNSLSLPYFVSPGLLILVPDAGNTALEVITDAIIEGGAPAVPDKGNAALPETDFKLSPAELGFLMGGVALLWWYLSK